jgi:hypothetical protein
MASSVTRLGELGGRMRRVPELEELNLRETSWGKKIARRSDSYQASDNASWWSLPAIRTCFHPNSSIGLVH